MKFSVGDKVWAVISTGEWHPGVVTGRLMMRMGRNQVTGVVYSVDGYGVELPVTGTNPLGVEINQWVVPPHNLYPRNDDDSRQVVRWDWRVLVSPSPVTV